MPVIDVSFLQGTIALENQQKLVAELTETLLKWEGATGNPRAIAGTFVYLHEIKEGALAIGGKFQTSADPARYRVELSVPFGTFSPERKQGLVEEVSKAVLAAEGTEWSDSSRLRVLCLIREIAEGNWGTGGRVLRLLDIARLLGVEPTSPRYQELEAALR